MKNYWCYLFTNKFANDFFFYLKYDYIMFTIKYFFQLRSEEIVYLEMVYLQNFIYF